jgi:trans-2-enoyl-CoA reductase
MMVQSFQQYSGEAFTYTVDWTVKVGKAGTSVSTATWSVQDGNATISGEALASSVTSALVTTGSEGCSLIKVIGVWADGQKDVHYFKVKAQDPSCSQSGSGKY